MNIDLSLLDKTDKKKFYFIILLGLLGTAFEIIGIGLIVPFLIIITDLNVLENNIYIKEFSAILGIEERINLIQISIIILLIVFSIKLAFLTYLSWFKHSFSYNVQSKISTRLFRIFLKQPYIYFSQLNSSKLIQETKDEPTVYCSGMIVGKIDMISEMLIICGICILLLFYNFLPSMIIFLTVLGILVTYRVIFRKSALRWSKQKKYFESLSYNILKYVYNSIIEVKINSKEKIVADKHESYVFSGIENSKKQMFMTDVPRLYLEYIAVFLFLIFILFAFKYYNDFSEFLPSVALFSVSAFKILPSINRVVIGIQKINFSKNSANVISDLLKLDIKNELPTSNKSIEFRNNIELKNVSFGYSAKKTIIKNLNLDIKFGEIIGIKGTSGAGKTTLVNLMLGLLNPDEGEILIDNKNLNEYVKGWQKIVSYAPQRTYILDDTIKRNICFEEEDKNIDIKYFNSILALSSIDKLTKNLDDNVDTFIGENGSQLSGGQIQRIGFARAIYKNPKFIVLDEITSSLDNNNEKIILDSVKSLSQKMTVLLISHREEPLKICKRVFELKNGNLNIINN